MTKIIVEKSAFSIKRARAAAVASRRKGGNNRSKSVRTIDAKIETFGDDLTLVFARNVARARRENKRVIGNLDHAPSEG